jgi:hypothetical protein
MAVYWLVLVPAHPMRLTRILASPLLRCLTPRSCHLAAEGPRSLLKLADLDRLVVHAVVR